MRVAPVSADLLIKLALVAGVLGLGVYVLRRSIEAGAAPVAAVREAAWAVTPWNPDNVIASPINTAVSEIVGYPETLGGAVADFFTPDPTLIWQRVEAPGGSYILGGGGAAFGIYPKP